MKIKILLAIALLFSPVAFSAQAASKGDGVKCSDDDICCILCHAGQGGNACMCDWPPQ